MHTPGPWNMSNLWAPPNSGYSIDAEDGNTHVADVYAGHHPNDRATLEIGTANAHIIAVAPAMLEVLKALVDAYDKGAEGGEHPGTVEWEDLDDTDRAARTILARIAEGGH